MTEQTGTDLRATAADTARQTRAVLAEFADPDSELTVTPATRNRLEGAAMALDAFAATDYRTLATSGTGGSGTTGTDTRRRQRR